MKTIKLELEFTLTRDGCRPTEKGNHAVYYSDVHTKQRRIAFGRWDGKRFHYCKIPSRFISPDTEPIFELKRGRHQILGFYRFMDFREKAVASSFEVEDVYPEDELRSWAESNGYAKAEDDEETRG